MANYDPHSLRRHVEFLCSPQCAGREAGSPEGQIARDYIAAHFRRLDLAQEQQFIPASRGYNVLAHHGRGDCILLGAHYDHLGRAWEGEAYWGADDNAAAVAIMLEVAQRITTTSDSPAMLFAAFDAEEPPFFLSEGMGSREFIKAPAVAPSSIRAAIILDLVGHALGDDTMPTEVRQSLFVLGAEKTEGLSAAVQRALAESTDVVGHTLDLDLLPPLSDYEPLRQAGIPVIFLTCGRWRHYHETTDTPDRLDYEKMAGIAGVVEQLVDAITDVPSVGRYQAHRSDHRGSLEHLRELARAAGAPTQHHFDVFSQLQRQLDGELSPSQRALAIEALAGLERTLR